MSNLTSTPFELNSDTNAEEASDLGTIARSLGLKPVRAWIPDTTNKEYKSGASRTQLPVPQQRVRDLNR